MAADVLVREEPDWGEDAEEGDFEGDGKEDADDDENDDGYSERACPSLFQWVKGVKAICPEMWGTFLSR